MDLVKENYTQINQVLERNGLAVMGAFWEKNAEEIQKTLNVVSYLIKKRGEDNGAKIWIAEGNLL